MRLGEEEVGSSSGSGGSGGSTEVLALNLYALNNLDDSSSTTYMGKVKLDGTWLVQSLSPTGTMLYANNSTGFFASYSLAWSNRLTLTYNQYQTLTGV